MRPDPDLLPVFVPYKEIEPVLETLMRLLDMTRAEVFQEAGWTQDEFEECEQTGQVYLAFKLTFSALLDMTIKKKGLSGTGSGSMLH